MNTLPTTRHKAAQAILADFRRWYAGKYGSKTSKRIVSKPPQLAAK